MTQQLYFITTNISNNNRRNQYEKTCFFISGTCDGSFHHVWPGCLRDSPYGNKQLFDFTYSFDTAIISLPDGTIVKGKVDSWTDYEDGDQIQVVINGTTYLVHSINVALMKK